MTQPEVSIFASSMKDVYRTRSATLLCNLQNFYPDVIKVVWNVAGSNEELESEKGELIHNVSSNTYSLYSWITIRKSDIGKIHKCRYKHESTGNSWKEKAYDTGKSMSLLCKLDSTEDTRDTLLFYR